MRAASLLLSLFCVPVVYPAQVGQGPTATVSPSTIPAPQDRAFSGKLHLRVDATDTGHAVFRVTETVPVQSPGALVLLYPEWETTSHSPTASAIELAGLHISAGGHEVPWRRDPFNVHAFHLRVPGGASSLSITFDYLPSFGGEIRPAMIVVPWQRVLLYPAGWYARDIPVEASLDLPPGFTAFTSLNRQAETETTPDGRTAVRFTTASLDRLVDAPVYAGLHARQFELGSAQPSPVYLDVIADAGTGLEVDAAALASFKALVTQAAKVFGPAPFSRYRALLSLSDELSPGGGQEHLEEGENNLPARFFSDYAHQLSNRDLVAHEYVHAWNGCYRQPAALWSPNFNEPTDPSLLWVYEGQTEFWGRVLAARSGMRNISQTLDKLALDAALVENRSGREWKNLADSTLDPLYMPGHSLTWRDWQRREDYYPEGVLLWIGVDARLRRLTHGKAGLDDFARLFFAAPQSHLAPNSRAVPTRTYTDADVSAALNAMAPGDWNGFFTEHLTTHDTALVMSGLKQAGWRLIYSQTPTETFLQDQAESGVTDLSYSIGLQVRDNGSLRTVAWNGPAFRSGLRPGARIESVSGKPFTPASLLEAVAHSSQVPVQLSVASGGEARSVTLAYAGPLRYPRLERIPGTQDWLTALLQSR